MVDEPKVRKCKASYKDSTGAMHTCNTTMPKGQPECKNKARHLSQHPTGFCQAGFHEGTRTRDGAGKPAKVCVEWQFCPCDCHTQLDQLFEMSGQERTPQHNPEYTRPKNHFWMPTPEERAMMAASFNSGGAVERVVVVVESPVPDAIPATVRRDFVPTPTGRAGRGQLESWVKDACDEWMVEKPGFPCTPAWIAEWVQKNKGIGTQSQGAVNAVLERWVKLGFAIVEKKPTRFTGYTPDGVRLGLDVMKAMAKADSKRKPNPTAALNRR